jgi:hypothetical protein
MHDVEPSTTDATAIALFVPASIEGGAPVNGRVLGCFAVSHRSSANRSAARVTNRVTLDVTGCGARLQKRGGARDRM